VKGTWREGSLAGDPEGQVENALETASLPIGALLGNLLEGSPTGDFERMKGALGMERLIPKRFRERASFTRDPGRYVKKGFGYRNHHRGPFTAEENLESGGKFIYWEL
jgi:hypothetical protein